MFSINHLVCDSINLNCKSANKSLLKQQIVMGYLVMGPCGFCHDSTSLMKERCLIILGRIIKTGLY